MPGGRPSKIDAVIGTRPGENGGPDVEITVADRIVELLVAGNYLEGAAAGAGVHKDTVYHWLKTGAQVKLRAGAGSIDDIVASEFERRCAEFSDAVAEAEGRYESSANLTLERLARGGVPLVTETVERGPAPVHPQTGGPTYDSDGREVLGPILKSSTRSSSTLPDAQVIEWRLTRRFRQRYAERVELTGAEGGPVVLSHGEKASAVLKLVRDLRAQKKKPPKETP